MSNKTEFAGLNKIGTYLDEDLPKINENTEITDAQLKQAAQEREALRESVERLAAVKPPEVLPATDKTPGIVRLATPEETVAGKIDTVAVTPAGLAAVNPPDVKPATTKAPGVVRLATAEEAATTRNDLAVTPAGLAAVIHTGMIAYFAFRGAPPGWLQCNGAALSRTVYANLFRAIGTLYGVGDGVTTFNLPDLRGEFLRGFDDGRGVDMGRIFGSRQLGSLVVSDWGDTKENTLEGVQGSDLYMDTKTAEYDVGGPYYKWFACDALAIIPSPTTSTLPSVIGEIMPVRPRNVALFVCIKY